MRFLLRHGHRTAVVTAALPNAASAEVREACLLAPEHAPDLAFPLVHKPLPPVRRPGEPECGGRHPRPDRPTLDRSDDQEKTAEVRAALWEVGGGEALRAVAAWEERNPHEPEAGDYLEAEGRVVGPFYSMAEIMLRGRREWVRYEMDQLHDRVAGLRDRTPP